MREEDEKDRIGKKGGSRRARSTDFTRGEDPISRTARSKFVDSSARRKEKFLPMELLIADKMATHYITAYIIARKFRTVGALKTAVLDGHVPYVCSTSYFLIMKLGSFSGSFAASYVTSLYSGKSTLLLVTSYCIKICATVYSRCSQE